MLPERSARRVTFEDEHQDIEPVPLVGSGERGDDDDGLQVITFNNDEVEIPAQQQDDTRLVEQQLTSQAKLLYWHYHLDHLPFA